MANSQTIIYDKIYEIRGQKVMLDRDLALLYGVETKRLNEAVKRNPDRFEGDDFMFQLTKDELALCSRSQIATLNDESFPSRSQIVTLNEKDSESQDTTQKEKKAPRRGTNIKYLPYAFTEMGVSMLSSVLHSPTAIQVNRGIMRTFVKMREAMMMPYPATYAELKQEIKEIKEYIEEILTDQNDINEETQIQLELINQTLAQMQTERKKLPPHRPIGFMPPNT